MDPQKYIETATDLQAAQLREYFGREYGRHIGASAYPIPPDRWPGMPAAPPPPDSYTLYYLDPRPKLGGGGVFVLDDDVLAFATQAQTLSDGALFSIDVAGSSQILAQLTAAGQAAVAPKIPDDF
jgi:hypothetical protein